MTWFVDRQFERAIKLAVGHKPPFPEEELRSIERLQVLRARDLSGLEACTSMRTLLLSGCDPVSFESLVGMVGLEVLIVEFSGLVSLDGIEELPDTLISLTARCNLIEDLSPLLGSSGLARVEVQGNPLSEDSFERVVAEMRKRGVQVLTSDKQAWRLTRRMHALGLPFSYYQADDGHRLCRPGLAFTDMPGTGHPRIDPVDLERMLDGDPAEIHALFERADLMYPPM